MLNKLILLLALEAQKKIVEKSIQARLERSLQDAEAKHQRQLLDEASGPTRLGLDQWIVFFLFFFCTYRPTRFQHITTAC